MVGPSRLVLLALAFGLVPCPARADDPKKPEPQAPAKPAERLTPAELALPGEDAPAAFVPRTPRTVADQKKVEATRLYAEARSLEDRGQLSQAIGVLEKALADDEGSIPVLRRLARLSTALGRTEKAVEYSRRVIASEPGDVDTIARLVEFYKTRRRDPGKAETLLKEALASPKLDRASAGAVLLEFELAKLYSSPGMQRVDKAAESLGRVVDAIDGKGGVRLSQADQRRILGADEGDTYVMFGQLFLDAGRRDQAIKCLKRAEVYDDANLQVALLLARAYLEERREADALVQVEKIVKHQPQGDEVYKLLGQILTSLKREKEIIPRLEQAAKADTRNARLKSLLADAYRAGGMNDKADALLKSMIEVQPDLQGFANVFATLLKEKKTEELLQLLVKAATRLRREDAVSPQIDTLATDPAYSDKVIDTGLAMLSATPPRLDRVGWFVLRQIAARAKRPDKVVDLLRWGARELPDPMISRELFQVLFGLNRVDEGEAAYRAMIERFPGERNPQNLLELGRARLRAGREDAAIEVIREVLKQLPNDLDAVRFLAFALNQKGKTDEALTLLNDALKNDPANLDLIRTIGGVYMMAGRTEASIAFYKSLAERFPNNEDIFRFAHSGLSTAYTTLGDFAKGESELEILYAKNPDEPGVNNDLGYLYADQGKNLEKAEAMIRKAVAEDPDNHAYLDSLGWVLFKRGKAREAIAPLQKAIEKLDEQGILDATVPEHLGDVYFEIKDRAKAQAAWDKAEKIAGAAKPPDKRAVEIRKKIESLKKLEPSPSPATGANP